VLVSYACSLITRVICRVRFVSLCRCGFREFVPNSRRHVISCLGVYCLLFELRFDVGSGNLKISTSFHRGNQVDGLPRAASI